MVRTGPSSVPPWEGSSASWLDRFLQRGGLALGALAILVALWIAIVSLVRVERGMVALLIKKTGLDLPDGEIMAPGPGYKGIQREMLSEGWHLLNPLVWEWQIAEQFEVPAGKVGVRLRHHGKPLRPGQLLADPDQKGIDREVLKPARYAINPLLESVILKDAVAIPPGYVGVVTLLAGRDPADPNRFVVDNGERGIQRATLKAGSHYVNPYDVWVNPIDLRSHRFDMMGEDAIEFPSMDGFLIHMEATVEWFVDPERVAQVFVEYVDSRVFTDHGSRDKAVIDCIVEKVILPNARALSRIEGSKNLAREFISGETRQRFQEKFLAGLSKACRGQGVVIKSALVRGTEPPKAIADPIREREIAVRSRDKYEQEMEREKQQKQLAMEVKLQTRMRQVKQAQADAAVAVTDANRQKEVALIEARRRLEVTRLELEAAKNLAAAILTRGKADADVLLLQNRAAASGIRAARQAFGDPEGYVRYLFLQKVGPSFKEILTNTEGPFIEIFRQFGTPMGQGPGRGAPARP